MTETAREFGLPMIVGVDRQHFGAQGRETFNTAVLVTPDGSWCEPGRLEQSYYDKMHLVPVRRVHAFRQEPALAAEPVAAGHAVPVRASGPRASC